MPKPFTMICIATAAFGLAACNELSFDARQAEQEVAQLGQDALRLGADVLDTRTACLLAGQSASFCTCLEGRLGSDISAEQIEALGETVSATLEGRSVQTSAGEITGANTETRDAIVSCATRSAIDGAITEAAN